MGTLASIAAYLALGEASKLLQEITLNPSKAKTLAEKVLVAAEKKGKSMLNKALEVINNIPQLSGSNSVKQYMIKARQDAQKNYNDVEQRVSDINRDAAKTANEIQSESDKSIFSKGWDLIKTGKTSSQRATDLANKAINKIETEV